MWLRLFRFGLGFALIVLSLGSVVQTIREIILWERGETAFAEDSFLELPFAFAGHTFTVTDDQPTDSSYSETEYEGVIQVFMDGEPLGPQSRALVRRGRSDLGRYHLWLAAWTFTNLSTGQQNLWLARRLQQDRGDWARYEVVVVDEHGGRDSRVYRWGQLGSSYPLFRSTQFVRDGWAAFPLSMVEGLGYWPALLVFPLGTFIVGWLVLPRRDPARLTAS